jgi:hypothetical protein
MPKNNTIRPNASTRPQRTTDFAPYPRQNSNRFVAFGKALAGGMGEA